MKIRILLTALLLLLLAGCVNRQVDLVKKEITVDERTRYQRIDGFGVNFTPTQWTRSDQKPLIDNLIEDLGASLFRVDITGQANWLDPARRNKEGKWPQAYLDSVYRTPAFANAWEAFGYLNKKQVTVFFNVSGRINPLLGRPDAPQHLADFDGYAEMCATMLKYARDNEMLEFKFFAPFNENNTGYPEGATILPSEMGKAVKAILAKLDEYGLYDVRLIIPDDSRANLDELKALLADNSYAARVMAFGTHEFGDGAECDRDNWYTDTTDYAKYVSLVRHSYFGYSSVWLTRYGERDQTGEIEYEYAWRSAKRLLKALHDGYNAAFAWDAFDHFNVHDGAWATYGLLKTDTLKWIYTQKKRYYAAKQVFEYVKPGMYRVALKYKEPSKEDVYKEWHDPMRNLHMEAFVSSDESFFTLVGMNEVEKTVHLTIHLDGLDPAGNRQKIYVYRTNKEEDCVKVDVVDPKTNAVVVTIPPRTIFTITTIHSYFAMQNIFNQ